ncbi:M48 family metallopeptidase [Deinococcus maricopensis]|uniref:Peptidase M48 Ste24p n=1 Tax=Deinococcus maricopensis (strain DSM 21211 / LMG 22137 / NRRL B-23946 / LB-34) TaxID=709986 RepID=E8U6J4_DEIML|nr:M48 family metallopeptidase [Deinococcus maricopensis]ADV66683.1 peptidase M48 Ste24p [Deinococcus maricopensis DSM 21211]
MSHAAPSPLERTLQHLADREAARVRDEFVRGEFEHRSPRLWLADLIVYAVLTLYLTSVLVGLLLAAGVLGAFDWNGMARLWAAIAATVLLGSAWMTRPRFNHPAGQVITDATHPETLRVIRDVAKLLGAPLPQTVLLTADYNAFVTRAGFPSRRVLGLGIPLLYALSPQERVALIAHELAHEVNGDPARSQLLARALHALTVTYAVLHPPTTAHPGPLELLAALLMRALSLAPMGVLWALYSLLGEDRQRAEFRADLLAARASGTPEMLSLLNRLHVSELFDYALHKQKRAPERENAFEEFKHQLEHASPATLEGIRIRIEEHRLRLDDSHPPTTDRVRVVAAHPTAAQYLLPEDVAARMVQELQPHLKDAERAASIAYEEHLNGY